jgi:hypothetical protein
MRPRVSCYIPPKISWNSSGLLFYRETEYLGISLFASRRRGSSSVSRYPIASLSLHRSFHMHCCLISTWPGLPCYPFKLCGFLPDHNQKVIIHDCCLWIIGQRERPSYLHPSSALSPSSILQPSSDVYEDS